MSSLSLLIRQQKLQNILVRGAKKKKGGGGGAGNEEVSSDIINIFKDRKDNEIKPLHEYPHWLLELALPFSPPVVYQTAWATDNDLYKPQAKDMIRYYKSLSRYQIKNNNLEEAYKNYPLDKQVTMPYQKNLFKRASADKGESAAGEASQEGEGEEDGEAAE